MEAGTLRLIPLACLPLTSILPPAFTLLTSPACLPANPKRGQVFGALTAFPSDNAPLGVLTDNFPVPDNRPPSERPVAIGCMRLSTAADRDDDRAIGVLHAAFDAGVTFLDTADAYCLDATETGHNERLIARALATWTGERRRFVSPPRVA